MSRRHLSAIVSLRKPMRPIRAIRGSALLLLPEPIRKSA